MDHTCSYYCDPIRHIHAIEVTTSESWNKERLLDYFTEHKEVRSVINIREVLEIDDTFFEMAKGDRECLDRSIYTNYWVAVLRVTENIHERIMERQR